MPNYKQKKSCQENKDLCNYSDIPFRKDIQDNNDLQIVMRLLRFARNDRIL
jgi:hypothetical protein